LPRFSFEGDGPVTTYESLPRGYTYTQDNISLTGFASAVTGASWPLTATTSGDGLAHKITIQNNSGNSKSGINIVIVGLDANGAVQTETLVGPGASATVTSAKYYSSLTSVTPASTWGADTANIGWAGSFTSAWINVNYLAENILTLVLGVTGTINFTVNQTFDKFDNPPTPVTPRWLAIAASQTANGAWQTTGGATGVQIIVNSYSNGAALTVNANATFVPNAASSSGSVDENVNLAEVGGAAIALGQAAMAASLPVVLASNQSAIPVSATQLPAALGQTTSAASLPVVPANDYFPAAATYRHIAAGQATTVVKASAGTLYALIFNGAATATNVTTVYDNASGVGTVIAIPAATTATVLPPLSFGPVGLAFANGLTIITTTANGADMTVVYR
jgi:hypothetical protein